MTYSELKMLPIPKRIKIRIQKGPVFLFAEFLGIEQTFIISHCLYNK